jgi:hypothetical protein
MGFTPFQLVYSLEFVLPIECEIPSLKLVIQLLPNTSAEEECLLYLTQLDEACGVFAMKGTLLVHVSELNKASWSIVTTFP